jgi:uncharacterized membrane protein
MEVLDNLSIHHQLLGVDTSSIDWQELPQIIFIDNYLQNIAGQLVVFLIATLLFTKIRSTYFKLILLILQSPFIFYAGFVSLKTVIDSFLDSEDEFSRNLFSAMPSIFILTIIFLSLFYQFISQKSSKRQQNIEKSGYKITFIKDQEAPVKVGEERKHTSSSVEIVPAESSPAKTKIYSDGPLVVESAVSEVTTSDESSKNLNSDSEKESKGLKTDRISKRENLRDKWKNI